MTNVGVGRTPTDEELALASLQKRFSPEKQVEFLQSTASRILDQTAVIGTVIAAGGLVAVSTILATPVSFWLMVAAVGFSTLAVLLALSTQVTFLRKMRVGNLNDIKAWFERYKSWRGAFLALATWLLLAAALLAAFAVGTALLGRSGQPTFDVTVSLTPGEAPAPDTYSVTANLTVPPHGADDKLTLTIESGGKGQASTEKHANGEAAITVSLEAAGLPTSEQVTVSGESDRWTCTATIDDAVVTDSSCKRKPEPDPEPTS